MSPEQMTALTNQVLNTFAADLILADDAQFEHLARQAEGLCRTDLGARKRAMVDEARARRVITASLAGGAR
jgi:hypothetical protein